MTSWRPLTAARMTLPSWTSARCRGRRLTIESPTDLNRIETSERLANDVIRVKLRIAPTSTPSSLRDYALDRHCGPQRDVALQGIAAFPMPRRASPARPRSFNADRPRRDPQIDVARTVRSSRRRVYRALTRNKAEARLRGRRRVARGDHGDAPRDRHRGAGKDTDEAAQRLRRRRIVRCTAQFETVARAVAKEEVVDLKLTLKSRARELIEDPMIAANGATARWLEASTTPRSGASCGSQALGPHRRPRGHVRGDSAGRA